MYGKAINPIVLHSSTYRAEELIPLFNIAEHAGSDTVTCRIKLIDLPLAPAHAPRSLADPEACQILIIQVISGTINWVRTLGRFYTRDQLTRTMGEQVSSKSALSFSYINIRAQILLK